MTGGDERLREEQMAEPVAYPTWVSEDVVPPKLTHVAAGLRVAVGLALAGVVVGALWAWLAPPVQIVVAMAADGDRVQGYVGDESDHVFLGALLMTGFLVVLAVTSAIAAWQWRAHRGPVMVGALTLGLLAAAGVSAGVGAALVKWRYGVIDLATAPVSMQNRAWYGYEAPAVFFGHSPLQIAASIVLPAGLAALLYAIGTLSVTRDDLGAWPPVGRPVYVVATDPVPTVAGDPPVDQSSPSH